jgi:hypothetical protein
MMARVIVLILWAILLYVFVTENLTMMDCMVEYSNSGKWHMMTENYCPECVLP